MSPICSFAQAASRQRDMAVRLALGATRGRLQRQMLIESMLLGIGGGVLGVVLSLWATDAFRPCASPRQFHSIWRSDIDWRVLVYSFALSVLSGLLLGLAPAWAAARPLLANALKGEDALQRVGRSFSLRNLLVVAQVAMSVILLSITGLFLRSLQSAATIDIGFRTENLLLLSIDPRTENYSTQRTISFLEGLEQSAQSLPGVASAVLTDVAPLSGGNRSDGFSVVGGR